MSKALGIDLGTTNSVVAVMEGGKPTVIANAEGNRTTPSVVSFSKTGERLVGQLARRQAVLNPSKTVSSIKRFIGRRFDEVEEERKLASYTVKKTAEGGCVVSLDGKDYVPEEISAMVLRKLKEDAEKYLGEKVTSAVITVPAYFNDSQRQSTKNAGAIAGLDVLRIINEPTAAALAYGFDKKGKNQTILVFDLGGGTFDVSILEVGEGVYEVKSTNGDTHLGGDDFDHVLVEYLASEFQKLEGVDVRTDPQALQRLTEAAEKAKIELSQVTETTVSLPFLTATSTGPKHLDTRITRSKFEDLSKHLIDRCRRPVEQAIKDAQLSFGEIDEVVLVGGSTRIPAVQALVKQLTGKDPNQTVNPDEVVAVGAAIQAGVIAGEVNDVVLLDVTPLSLGIETMGGVFTKLVERNTTIPCTKSQVFSTAEDNQPGVDVYVFQGERPMARDNKLLGNFRLDGIKPAPRGLPQIEVSLDIDANGILNVSAKDKATGKEQKITITASTNLSKDDIDRMIKESEKHATEDQKWKEDADTRNEADAMCYQVERLLAELGAKVSGGTRARAENAVRDLRTKLEQRADSASIKRLMDELRNVIVLAQQDAAQPASQGNTESGAAQSNPFNGQNPFGGQGSPFAGAAAGSSGRSSSNNDDDVIDAEYTAA